MLTEVHIPQILGRALLAIFVVGAGVDHASLDIASADEAERAVHRTRVEAPRQRASRSPVIPDGLIAGFENGEIGASFGAGWTISTDASIGGGSTAEMAVVDGGADNSSMSLRVTGRIVRRSGSEAWAGAVFSPGRREFVAANLSEHAGISFWVRGSGAPMSVAVFARSLGQEPVMLSRPTTDEWVEHRLAFSEFNGVDPAGLKAVSFSGVADGDFEFQIDEFRVW